MRTAKITNAIRTGKAALDTRGLLYTLRGDLLSVLDDLA